MEMVIYIKGDSKIERVQKMNAMKIVKLARGPNIASALSTRQDILTIRQHKGMIVFRTALEGSKRILEQNDFWAKKISMATILRQERAGVVVHEMRVKGMLEDMKKDESRAL